MAVQMYLVTVNITLRNSYIANFVSVILPQFKKHGGKKQTPKPLKEI